MALKGLVQGVFFRAFARQQARALRLNGFAENLPDGSLKIIAEGEKEKLEAFIEKIKKGPESARIKECAVEWKKAGNEFNGFRIVY
ncbi:acylphosphatase [archaeon]|nr:acylphosphatase [archaeon]